MKVEHMPPEQPLPNPLPRSELSSGPGESLFSAVLHEAQSGQTAADQKSCLSANPAAEGKAGEAVLSQQPEQIEEKLFALTLLIPEGEAALEMPAENKEKAAPMLEDGATGNGEAVSQSGLIIDAALPQGAMVISKNQGGDSQEIDTPGQPVLPVEKRRNEMQTAVSNKLADLAGTGEVGVNTLSGTPRPEGEGGAKLAAFSAGYVHPEAAALSGVTVSGGAAEVKTDDSLLNSSIPPQPEGDAFSARTALAAPESGAGLELPLQKGEQEKPYAQAAGKEAALQLSSPAGDQAATPPPGMAFREGPLPERAAPEKVLQGASSALGRADQLPLNPPGTDQAIIKPLHTLNESILEKINARIASWKEAGSLPAEMRVSLKPPALGELIIRVLSTKGGLSAEIITESAMVKELLEAGLGELRQRFQQHGLPLERIEILAAGWELNGGENAANFGSRRFYDERVNPEEEKQVELYLKMSPIATAPAYSGGIDFWA